MSVTFLSDLFAAIAERGRGFIPRHGDAAAPAGTPSQAQAAIALAEQLLSRRGEASGVAIASEILAAYAGLSPEARLVFFQALAERFGPESARLDKALSLYQKDPSDRAAQALHEAAEPRRQGLFRRLNLAPGGTQNLVNLRSDLLRVLPQHEALDVVDHDLEHLFSSWFNRGFLVVRKIDWTSPAHILEKLIRYEAVHAIKDWSDLRRRTEPADRRCFAFFHPALVDEPLIFVEVALTRDVPAAIAPLLAADRQALPAAKASVAVFYSISNCQEGLRGVSFGNFLIKQVAEEMKKELPNLETFATLSPVPGFAKWLDAERRAQKSSALAPEDRVALATLDDPGWHESAEKRDAVQKPLLSAAAYYFLRAKNKADRPLDPVARFHLGNGARLERLDFLGDVSVKGLRESHGLMVNYRYDLGAVEKNHEAYADRGAVAASSAVTKALRHQEPPQPKPAPAKA